MTFTNLVLTIGFGHILVLLDFVDDHEAPLPSLDFIMRQLMPTFPMLFQCFHRKAGGRLFWSLVKSTKRHRRQDALQGAHVRKVSACVTFGAP